MAARLPAGKATEQYLNTLIKHTHKIHVTDTQKHCKTQLLGRKTDQRFPHRCPRGWAWTTEM